MDAHGHFDVNSEKTRESTTLGQSEMSKLKENSRSFNKTNETPSNGSMVSDLDHDLYSNKKVYLDFVVAGGILVSQIHLVFLLNKIFVQTVHVYRDACHVIQDIFLYNLIEKDEFMKH